MTQPEKKTRRKIRFESLDEILADIESLAAVETETVGGWTFAQIAKHLALSMDAARDDSVMRAPFYVRIVGWWFKKRALKNGFPPGFQMPDSTTIGPAPDTDFNEALTHFRQALADVKTKSIKRPHPVFGMLTPEEWKTFHQRHAELHLSFVRPVKRTT